LNWEIATYFRTRPLNEKRPLKKSGLFTNRIK